MTKQVTTKVLKDIDNMSSKKGVHIEQIRVEDLQVSRDELKLKDIISEGNVYYYEGDYCKAMTYYDRVIFL